MKPNAHQLIAFAQVMREGSFSAAARKMGVTQSALSQHVGKLETLIGARLMTRDASGLALTQAGSDLFDLAERFASLTAEIDAHLTGYSRFESGHLNIIANAPQPALSAIARYSRDFPRIEISFTLFDWTRTMAMLSEQTVDIAFITRPRLTGDCEFKRVSSTRYVLYVPQDHPLAGRQQISLADLRGETLILPERGSLTLKVVGEALARHGIEPQRRLNTTTFPVMKEAILHGVGVGIFLASAAAPHDNLAEIPVAELTDSFDIHAAVPRHKLGLRLVMSFWESLETAPSR